MSDKLEAWKAWCKQTSSNVGDDAFTLEKSSHGKAFSFAWDAATETQQKRIGLYEQALKASWPEGAMGDAFDYWNAARKEDV